MHRYVALHTGGANVALGLPGVKDVAAQ